MHAVLQALQLQSFEWFSKKHEFHMNKVYDLGIKKNTYLVSVLDKQLVAKKHKNKKSKLSLFGCFSNVMWSLIMWSCFCCSDCDHWGAGAEIRCS